MELLISCLKAFAVGGALCAVGQVLIDRTKLTPARILTIYVVAGVILGAVGVYQPLVDWAGAGASIPLTGFGSTLAKGVREAVAEKGVLALRLGCPPRADNSTLAPREVFSATYTPPPKMIAVPFAPIGRETLRGFFDKLKHRSEDRCFFVCAGVTAGCGRPTRTWRPGWV